MDQPLEFPYEAPTHPHEEVPATSPEQKVQLDDVIERIERISINDEAPPADQPGPSRKIPKWATKTLESVHLDEFGNMVTRSSTRQEDGGEADNPSDDMDASFDCELNLYANLEPNSFKEASTHAEWKESMHNENYALMNNGT